MTPPGRFPPEPHILERQMHRWDRIAAALRRHADEEAEKPPHRPVIAISGSEGSNHGEVGIALAEELGYELFGRKLVEKVAVDLKLDQPIVDGLDERVESEIRLILSTWMRGREIESSDYVRSLVRVIVGIARSGGAVLLGRGSNFILKKQPDKVALFVRVDAPLDVRTANIMKAHDVSEKEAQQLIDRRDREKANFIRRYFDQDINQASQYDLIVNTGSFSIQQAVRLIIDAISIKGTKLEKFMQ